MELYVLRVDNYNEWAWECGACELVGVYDDKQKAIEELVKLMSDDVLKDRYLDYDIKDFNNYHYDDRNNYYIDVYDNESDYDSGKNNATYVIEKKILNENGTII